MTAAPDPVFVGSLLTYSIYVTNHGPANATGVTLTDVLPAGVSLVSAVVSQGDFETNIVGTVICNLGNLVAGTGATASIVVRPGTAGAPINSISVLASETDLTLANNTAQAATTVLNVVGASLDSSTF